MTPSIAHTATMASHFIRIWINYKGSSLSLRPLRISASSAFEVPFNAENAEVRREHRGVLKHQMILCFFAASCNPTLALVFHVSRGGLGHVAAEVSVHHAQREIDTGRQATRGRDLLVLNKAEPALNADVWKCLFKPIEKVVVR